MTQPTIAPFSVNEFDVVIIGGGTIGLAAAYYSARARYKTLLLEQFDFWNSKASSGGYSRIFRVMHSDRHMAQLAEISLALWREIEAAGGGREILYEHPLVFFGSKTSDITPEGKLSDMAKTMNALGIPFQELDRAGLLREFPVFKTLPDDYFGYVQPNSAAIRVRDSIELFWTLASRDGAVLLKNQKATITPNVRGGHDVTCAAGRYHARHLILCPGAWTNELLRAFGLSLELPIWQMSVAYFEADTATYRYPLWYEFGPHNGLLYGFPPVEFPGEIKVSLDFTTHIFSRPEQCTYKPDPVILKSIQEFLGQRFRGVQASPKRVATCLYTMSKDQQRVLGVLPNFNNVAIFTGDSGRGFKFTPLFGRILVELATTGRTYYDISPFSPGRVDATGQALFQSIPGS